MCYLRLFPFGPSLSGAKGTTCKYFRQVATLTNRASAEFLSLESKIREIRWKASFLVTKWPFVYTKLQKQRNPHNTTY